jgi:succinyl-CoA synthetase beta subunit
VLLIEADGKALFAEHGIAVPAGVLIAPAADPPGDGPRIVKAQVPTGGRGKACGVRRAATPQEVRAVVQRPLGTERHQIMWRRNIFAKPL